MEAGRTEKGGTDMMELLRNAWNGWINYTTGGKLVALFMAALLYLWFWKKKEKSKQFLFYATVASFCCIVPVTAAIVMTYQTRFYDYEWIWSMVPVTAVVAYGMACFFADICCGTKERKKSTCYGIVAICLATILLCGSMGQPREDMESAYKKLLQPYGFTEEQLRRQAYKAIAEVNEIAGGAELVLWAPIEIMEYAREADAGIRLAYGRNAWDAALNAYSYDTYDEVIYDMYLWMELQNATCDKEYAMIVTGASEVPSGEECIEKALELGVNCILLPAGTYRQTIKMLENAMGAEARRIEKYWVIYE